MHHRDDFWAGTSLPQTGCAAPSPARLMLPGYFNTPFLPKSEKGVVVVVGGLTQRGGCHPAAFPLPSWGMSLPRCWKMGQNSSLPSLAPAKGDQTHLH